MTRSDPGSDTPEEWHAALERQSGSKQFARTSDVTELMFQVVGAGSRPTNWMSDGGKPATRDEDGRECIFQDRDASEIARDGVERLQHLVKASLARHLVAELGKHKPGTMSTAEFANHLVASWRL